MRPTTCIHFTGIYFTDVIQRCSAGVDYEAAFKDGGIPCIRGNTPNKHGTCCEHFTAPTAEQLEEWKRKRDESLQRLGKALPAVIDWTVQQAWSKKNKVAATGKVPCGACGIGEIHLSMAAYNGHVWGKCTTIGCVEWLQ